MLTGQQIRGLALDHGLKVLAGLIVLGLVLFGIDRCSTWRTNRDIEARKANVNAALANIANVEANIAFDKGRQEEQKAAVNAATQDYLMAVNATDEARSEVNAALANVEKAKNANQANVSIRELEEKLKRLEQ